MSIIALSIPMLLAAQPAPGGIPRGAVGPVMFACTPAARLVAAKQLAKPFDAEEGLVHRDIKAASCVATGPVFGEPWILTMRDDTACAAGKKRFGAFAKARVGIWRSLTDVRVCAAKVALSDKARGPGLPVLIIDGRAYQQPDGTYRLR
ncbi:hypothetical protein [Sphingomonas sp. M1-B02]|uniref:hypothetical protein n=1 Tax=Sphingomonas sp. M1-B02 TaxID=3114300 RepID=UPI00223EB2EE|nr:hypothetical protein [Sphingomonas sp. S6-11]UZK66978.1 hypothetical protein OKW87_03870 [Sphingomonas sp. S6-11]